MKRILVVEDDSWQAEYIARQLERAGYRVQVAAHALQAIEVIDQQLPDIIILDMFLPGANGVTLLHEIRSHADLAHIPVIVCSAEQVSAKQLKPYGVVEVLDKTIMTNADLQAAVRRVLA